MSLIELFKDNIFAIISIVIGVSGLAYGIYNNKRNKKERKPAYSFKTNLFLTNPKMDGLEIFFKKNPVSSIMATRLIFMNEGKLPIDKSDIPDGHTIFIKKNLDAVKIYDYSLIYTSRDANQFNLVEFEDGIEINFEYINFNDGCVIQIMHNSVDGEDLFGLIGEVKGVNEIKKITPLRNYTSIIVQLLPILFVALFFLTAEVGERLPLSSFLFSTDSTFLTILFLLVLFVLLIFIPFFLTKMVYELLQRNLKKYANKEKRKLFDTFDG